MPIRFVFTISLAVLLLLCSSLVVSNVFASKAPSEINAHGDDINGPGGIMSLSGSPVQVANSSNPLQLKEHHPTHVKKFIGPSASLSGGESPANVWAAYGFNKLSCTHTTTTDWTDPNLCGHGQTIAIVDAFDDPSIANDLQTFDIQFGLPSCTVSNGCFTKNTQGATATDSGWALEIALDVQWAHAIAPGAKIVLVESLNNTLGSLLSGEDAAVGTGAQQVSNSWGGGEFSTESNYDYHFNSPTANFYVASGDGGHGVSWPASSPYVISVGGTTLTTDNAGNWVSETTWSGSGGGISAYESKPSYQNNVNTHSKRTIPDVAYDGDPNTGFYVYDSVALNGNSGWWVVGGTSAGTPQWASISAIANSQNAKLASASFGASSALYAAASGAQSNPQTNPYVSNYHDITSGSDGTCGSLCNAILGYDEVTGFGSPQSNNIIPYLAPNTNHDFIISSNTSLTTINAGASSNTTITVSSVNGFSDTVNLGVVSPSKISTSLSSSSVSVSPTNAGLAKLTISPDSTAGGAYSVIVNGTSGSLSHSTTISVTVLTVPSAPQNLAAVAGNSHVSLSWNAPISNGGSPVASYDIYRNGTQIATNVILTNYNDTGLTNGDTYTYQVTAVNTVGQSLPSNSVSATPIASATPLTVTASPISGTYTGSQSVTLTASAPGTIYYTTNGTTPTTSSTSGPSPITGIIISTNSTLKFFAKDSLGNVGTMSSASYTIIHPVVIQMSDTTASFGLSVYTGRPILAEYVSSTSFLVGKSIDTIIVDLKKVGTPTGNTTVGIFNTDLSVKKIIGTINTSTTSTSYKNYTFSLPASQSYQIQSGDRIGIKYTGGNASNYVAIMTDQNAADPFDGTNSYLQSYTTIWNSYTTQDLYMILSTHVYSSGPTVTASPISGTYTGSQSVTLTASAPGTIYYTTNGTTPTTSSTSGPSPITGIIISTNSTLKFFAKDVLNNSGPVSYATYVILTAPGSPTGLTVLPGDNKTLLSWTPPLSSGGSPITNYKIYRSTTSNTETLLTIVGNVLSFSDTGLTNGQPYYYKVSAVNAINEGPQSVEANATPIASATPLTVTASPISGTYTGSQSITLTASAPGTIYYTTNGTTPTTSSTSGPSPITGIIISTNSTLKFFAKDSLGNVGTMSSASYTIIHPVVIQMSDTTASFGLSVYTGRPILAEYVSSTSFLVGKSIDTIIVDLKKVGTPTGNATVGIFNTDLSVKKIIGTINTSTTSTSYKNYTFSLPASQSYQIQSGDRIGIKYTGGNASNYVAIMTDQNAADPFDGTNSYLQSYTTIWNSYTTQDLYMILKGHMP